MFGPTNRKLLIFLVHRFVSHILLCLDSCSNILIGFLKIPPFCLIPNFVNIFWSLGEWHMLLPCRGYFIPLIWLCKLVLGSVSFDLVVTCWCLRCSGVHRVCRAKSVISCSRFLHVLLFSWVCRSFSLNGIFIRYYKLAFACTNKLMF